MSRQWTGQQKNAINATEGSVLVSAAAGSGKTAVLVERVVQLITREDNPVDVDRLLIVTFTRDAAAEMRERISAAINLLLENNPYNSHFLKQKQLLYNASISTIDSFCSDVVREYFHTLDIARDFRIAEKGELDILSKQALDSTLEIFYREKGSEFISLVDAFSSKRGDERLRETVLKISEFLSTQPFPDKWLDDMLQNYRDMPISETIWGEIIINNSHSAVSHAINLTENSLSKISEDEKLQSSFITRFETDLEFLNTLQKKLCGSSWNDIVSFISTFEAGRLTPPKGYKDNPIKLSVAANRDEVKSTVARLQSFFKWNEDEARREIFELHRIVTMLFELVKEYNSVFMLHKIRKNILSFSDIELLAVKLLAAYDSNGYIKTKQAYEISKRYDAVMVDEFQDVNDVQDLIFKAVSNDEKNIFVVGDVKQSIYGFRQAKPEIFIRRKNQYDIFNENNPQYPAKIILDKNFRSRKEVCNAVNFIFQRLMTKSSSKMDYSKDEFLNNGAEYPKTDNCNFEITLIERNSFDTLDYNEVEAYYIADRIHKMMSSGFCVKDGNELRRVTFGDFAVIMRSPKTKAAKYVNTLINCGIPAYSESKESFFDAVEIKIMLNLLRVIDNPTLDIPLLSVMCSPVYSFTPDELALIRSDNMHASLYSAVKLYAEKDKKSAEFICELSAMREYSYTCSVDELIARVCEITSFKAVSLAVSGNDTSLRNLNLLREYARIYESNGYKTLSDFISYIDKLIENGTDLSASSANDSSGINSVRVMSIHSSKGLEYPVCFIADTGHQFNKSDLKDDILIDSHAGLGIKRKSGLIKYGTLPHLAVGIEMSENEIAEEMRVLYVALTRAKEKLIIISSQKNTDKYLNNLYSKIVFGNIIEPYSVVSCRSISDWICLCALVHPSLNSVRKSVIPLSTMIPCDNADDNWEFKIVKDNDFLFGLTAGKLDFTKDSDKNISIDNNDTYNYAELLKKNLEFKYKNSEILSLPQKVSASDIAHEQNNSYFEKILAVPSFMNKKVSSSVEKGTAHHRFLQYCDFKKAKIDIDSEIIRLIQSGTLDREQAECINKANIVEFLNSALINRIMNSSYVVREERFTAKLKPSLIFDEYKDIKTEARVIIQGAVDLAFEEDGMLVIVDYKTDRINEIEKLRVLYAKQLLLYKEAMQQSTELKVKECILYSVHLNQYITL